MTLSLRFLQPALNESREHSSLLSFPGFPMQLKLLMAEVPEELRARRRREVLPRFYAGSEVNLESDHTAARRLEDDDCGASIGLVAGVDAVPIRVPRPIGGASETWATCAE